MRQLSNSPIQPPIAHCQSSSDLIHIALVSDFYYPFVGGVEIHIKQLATRLHQKRGAKIGNVIVITHKYTHNGIEYTGIKNHHGFNVYYLNILYHKQHMVTFPTFFFNFPLIKEILKKEKINIVHCHQSGSTLALQTIFFSNIMGLRVILTQHSLYGTKSMADIHFNRVSQLFLAFCDRIIAVSRATRNNLVVRAKLQPERVTVIPNGVSNVTIIRNLRNQRIRQEKKQRKSKQIVKIVTVGRMAYRRGTDLFIQILPELCQREKDIQIYVIGDGLKRRPLQIIIHKFRIQQKVKLLGIISDHQQLLSKISQCDIFLNTPLTQSFGIALAEAAMIGLLCVSTNVGGVKQAVPAQWLITTSVDPRDLIEKLQAAIKKIRVRFEQKEEDIKEVKLEYPWEMVCERTIEVYEKVIDDKRKGRLQKLGIPLRRLNFLQIAFCILSSVLYLIYQLICG